MSNRLTYTSASPGPILGTAYMDQISGHIKKLYDAAAFPLTSIGGTGNAVTAVLDPILDGSGLVSGMRFGLTWAAGNTGGVTLAINGGSAVSVLDATGAALPSGANVAGTRALLEYVGGAFRVIGSASGASLASARYFQAFTISGTWTKPAGLSADTMVKIEAWGGGGGGGGSGGTPSSGGGGGAYQTGIFRLGDLPSTLSITIGTGGAGGSSGTSGAGGVGGNTTVGSILTAYGGDGGSRGTSVAGGDGGGAFGHGGSGAGSGLVAASTPDAVWPQCGGGGAFSDATVAGGATISGGGGGGARGISFASLGGKSVFGGGGGNGVYSGAGLSGSAPAGGGGGGSSSGGAGARGEVRFWF